MRPRNNNARFFLICVTNNLPKIFSTELRDLGCTPLVDASKAILEIHSQFLHRVIHNPRFSKRALYQSGASNVSRGLVYQAERGLIS
jgi:hypothetical protein